MKHILSFLIVLSAAPLLAATSEIRVDLKLDSSDFIVGERVRGVINVANSSPDRIRVGYPGSQDACFVEVSRVSDGHALARTSKSPFVAAFRLEASEGMKLETFLADHYALREQSRYLAKPVLVHDGMRYEGQPRAFDIVDGVHAGGALQLFKNRDGLQREFELVYWSKNHGEHLYLKAMDLGPGGRTWETRDLGAILRISAPTISVLPTGEVIIFHRLNTDQFIRTEFWSLPDELLFRTRESVMDPETAGTQRVRELYKEGGIKPKTNPWWKFW